jgi:hypothetical protein
MEGKTGVDVQTPSGRKLHFIWLPEVSSTQDEMKALIKSEVRPDSQQHRLLALFFPYARLSDP